MNEAMYNGRKPSKRVSRGLKEVAFKGRTYVCVPDAASVLGLNRVTLSKWCSNAETPGGVQLQVIRDRATNHLYIAKESMGVLEACYGPEVRFEEIRPRSAADAVDTLNS